jgi:hypothetical protein
MGYQFQSQSNKVQCKFGRVGARGKCAREENGRETLWVDRSSISRVAGSAGWCPNTFSAQPMMSVSGYVNAIAEISVLWPLEI